MYMLFVTYNRKTGWTGKDKYGNKVRVDRKTGRRLTREQIINEDLKLKRMDETQDWSDLEL